MAPQTLTPPQDDAPQSAVTAGASVAGDETVVLSDVLGEGNKGVSTSRIVMAALRDMVTGVLKNPIRTAEEVRALRADTLAAALNVANDDRIDARPIQESVPVPVLEASAPAVPVDGPVPNLFRPNDYAERFPEPSPIDPLDAALADDGDEMPAPKKSAPTVIRLTDYGSDDGSERKAA